MNKCIQSRKKRVEKVERKLGGDRFKLFLIQAHNFLNSPRAQRM